MSVIGAFQTFDSAYVISTARAGTLGRVESTLFYMLHLYNYAFQKQQMGYAECPGVDFGGDYFYPDDVHASLISRVFYESERKG
jgi:hypothetical protein